MLEQLEGTKMLQLHKNAVNQVVLKKFKGSDNPLLNFRYTNPIVGCGDYCGVLRAKPYREGIQTSEESFSSCLNSAVQLDRPKNQSTYLYLSYRLSQLLWKKTKETGYRMNVEILLDH